MFERRVWMIANLALAVLLLLSLRVVYWQQARSGELYLSLLDPVRAASRAGQDETEILTGGGLQNLPQPLIQRTVDMLRQVSRGSIYDRNGEVLADDRVDSMGTWSRVYREPSLAHTLGYVSGIRTGTAGLELRYNTTLLGLNRLDAQIRQLIHEPVRGSDLVLTIDLKAQQAAAAALGQRTGAAIAIDASTGAVLALVSTPGFDPNRMLEEGYAGSLRGLNAPFLNRATQGQYTPGSTWKTIPLIAGLDSGQVTPETVFDFGEPLRDSRGRIYYVYRVGGGVIPDPNHEERRLDLGMSYAKSANAAFAKIGDEMDPETLIAAAARFGFSTPEEQRLPVEIDTIPGQLATDVDEIRSNDLLRAATAIGQGELQANVYTMTLPVLAVMNDGNLPVPYLVEQIREPSGLAHRGPQAGQVERGTMKAETARQVREMMVMVVERGYGANAKVAGVTVGGKTGTAQLGGDQAPHAWFLGFAQRGEQAVVICVMVENGGEGSVVAAPIFAQMVTPALDALVEKE